MLFGLHQVFFNEVIRDRPAEEKYDAATTMCQIQIVKAFLIYAKKLNLVLDLYRSSRVTVGLLVLLPSSIVW